MKMLIQVNTSNEESKFGVYPNKAMELEQQVLQLQTLRIKGLMTIGLLGNDADKVRACFRLLKNI